MKLVPFDGELDDAPKGLKPFDGELDDDKGFISGAKGTLAAIGDLAAGIPKIGARTLLAVGGKLADPSTSLQSTWESAGSAIEDTFPSFGKNMQGNLGYEVPMKPFELYGEGAEWAAEKASFGNKDVQGALNIAANFAPIPLAGKAARGAGKVIEAVDPGLRAITPESVAKQKAKPTLEEALSAKAPAKLVPFEGQLDNLSSLEGPDGQMALWDQQDSVQARHPYQAEFGEWRVDENGIPIRADLSMELQNLEQPLQRNLWGDELPRKNEQEAFPLTAAIDEMPNLPWRDKRDEGLDLLRPFAMEAGGELSTARMDANGPIIPEGGVGSFNTRTRKQGGAISTDVFLKDFPEFAATKIRNATGALKEMYRGVRSDYTGPERPMRGEFGEGVYLTESKTLANTYASGGKEGSQVRSFYVDSKKPFELELDSYEYKQARRRTPEQKDRFTAELKANGYDSLVVKSGDQIKELVAFNPEQVKSAYSSPSLGIVPKGQKGAVLFDWKKKPQVDALKRIAGIKENLKNFIPSEMTAEAVIEHAKTLKDVDQNIVQKAINPFTKGGLYQAEKTNNPVIKFTVDKVLEADRLSRGDVRDYIHDTLAPAFRELNTKEMVDVATVVNYADLKQIPITPEFMKEQGFNQKQMDAIQAHRTTMDYAFEQINKARAAMGKKPMEKRIAYAAMHASGDFRKLVYSLDEAGEKTVVGIIGARTKWGLANIEKKLEGKGYTYGEQRFYGSQGRDKGGSAVQAVQQALEHLSDTNPATKQFLEVIADMSAKDAYSFMNAKVHTKQKKGVFGMDGRKTWESDKQNAKDLMDAQLQYAETAIKWGHLSDAVNEVKKVLSSDVDMPNAKQWSESYIQNALGFNPTETGRKFEAAVDSAFGAMGIGKSIPADTVMYAKRITNALLLGLNPAFLATNLVQPLVAMPAMNSFLKGRGLDQNSLMTLGYDGYTKASYTLFKERFGGLNEIEKGAQEYANKYHVYGSDLVDTSNRSRKNAEYYLDKTGNFLASNVESATRRLVYYSFVHMLDKNGMGKEYGLAHNLTDMAMNNYSGVERPQIFNTLGPIGDMAANLSSFKHNEFSRLAMFAREIGKDGNATPFLTQIATGVVAAGVLGTVGFSEADWLYKQITKAMGKPDSLTRMVIDASDEMSKYTKDKTALSHGIFSYMGLDMSKRLGISDVIPNSLGEAVFPGGSKLVDVAGAGYEAAKNPDEMNLKRFAREAAPGVLQGPMDRNWFSKQTPQGELAVNRRTLEGQVIRNDADKMAKNFGFTGVNESVRKQKLFETENVRTSYADLRRGVLKKISNSVYVSGKPSEKLVSKYLEYEGDPNTLVTDITGMVKDQSIDAVTAAKLKALVSKSVPQLRQAERLQKAFPNEPQY